MSAPKVERPDYGEPWRVVIHPPTADSLPDCVAVTSDPDPKGRLPVISWTESAESPRYVERAANCVNALAGLDPAALPLLIEAAQLGLQLANDAITGEPSVPPLKVRSALREALAALKGPTP